MPVSALVAPAAAALALALLLGGGGVVVAGPAALAFPAAVEAPSALELGGGPAVGRRALKSPTEFFGAITATFYSRTTCSTEGGPTHMFSTGCTEIAGDAHGMTLRTVTPGCAVTKWENADCTGLSSQITSFGCENMGREWSSIFVWCNRTCTDY